VDSHDAADISHQVSPAVCGRKVLFYVLSPHTHDCVPVVTVQLSVLPSKGKTLPCLFAEKFREKFSLDGVDGIEAKPASESGQCDM
jgi:hypothetical protein